MNVNDITGDQSQMILVQGIGQMRLDQAQKRVQQMLQDLSGRVDNLVWKPGEDNRGWDTIKTLLDRGTLQAYLEAISQAMKRQH